MRSAPVCGAAAQPVAVSLRGQLHRVRGRSSPPPGGDGCSPLLCSRTRSSSGAARSRCQAKNASRRSGYSFHLSAKFSSSWAGLGTHQLAVAVLDEAAHAGQDVRVRGEQVELAAVGPGGQGGDEDRRRPVVRVVGEEQHAVPLEDLHDALQGGADLPLGHVGDVDVPLRAASIRRCRSSCERVRNQLA